MNRTSPWIEAMRLRTLPVSVAGVITGTAYAVHAGDFAWIPFTLCLLFALLAQIASNFANEYFDFTAGLDCPGREGPRRGVTEGDITPHAMLGATIGTLALACLVGLALVPIGGLWLIPLGIAIAVAAIAYSAGPWPLSRHGLGEVAVIIFFGVIPVWLTAWLQMRQCPAQVMLGGVAVGLLAANVLIVNNYRDADDDRAVGKHTLAVILGPKAMPWLYLINGIVALGLVYPQWAEVGMPIVPPLLAVAAGAIALMMTRRKGSRLTPLLGMTAMLLLLYSLLFLVLPFPIH